MTTATLAPDLAWRRADGNHWSAAAGALLVPVPIAVFLALRAAGAPTGVAEDLVTLLVMVPLGGPHVVAPFRRTLGNPCFWRQQRGLGVASVLLLAAVFATVCASVFGDVRLAGAPAMAFLLTGFFFWAGLHVVQQHGYVAERLVEHQPPAARDRLGFVDHAVMLLAMYPAALFRMSMAAPGTHGAAGADPKALATRLVRALGGSAAFADEYVFRIGRAVPVLPEFARHPALWIGTTALFLAAVVAFAVKALRARARGVPFGARGRLVLAMAACGVGVPLMPNLDSAFQGLNAWHCVQYLVIAPRLEREAVAAGELCADRLARLSRPGGEWAAYWRGVGATLLLVALLLVVAAALTAGSGWQWPMFGHDVPPMEPASGRRLDRPGSLLLAYYLLGFGLLLVHYLHDTVFFLRGRAQTAR